VTVCSHAASAAGVFMMVSNSIGVKRPRAACRRRRWQVRSIQVTIAMRSSFLPVQERRLRTRFCSRLKKALHRRVVATRRDPAHRSDKAVAGQNTQELPVFKLRPRSPLSFRLNSDRGTQYGSAQITAFAAADRITRSMGYTGICRDCDPMSENFFATLKTEFCDRRVWPTKARAAREVKAWTEKRYNRRRRHSAIGQVSPVEFELQYSTQTADLHLAAQRRVHQPGARPVRPTPLFNQKGRP
jgi:transposase InsO family protein